MSDEDEDKPKVSPAPTQEALLQQLSEQPDSYQKYLDRLDPKKVQRITGHVNRMRTGLHAIAPTICLGPTKCMWYEHCPIPTRFPDGTVDPGEDEDYPISQPCILENFYMRQKILDYVAHLDVDPANPVEMSIVNELALIDLMKNRALMILGTGDRDGQGRDLLRIDVTGYSENGDASKTTALHPAAGYIDQLEKRREKWLDKLIQTRKSQAEMRIKTGQIRSGSKLLEKMSAIAEGLAELQTKSKQLVTTGEDDGSIDFED